MIEGHATKEGTARFAARHAERRFHDVGGAKLSDVGHGTYLGTSADPARRAYQDAILASLDAGTNVLDTAANYRDQASERDVGAALRRFMDASGTRDEVLVSTKAGFLHGDCESDLGKEWFQQEYVADGTIGGNDIVGHVHCMAPDFIRREVERSRRNLALETLDVVHIHNPETQLAAGIDPAAVYARLEEAFCVLEEARDAGHVRVYGIATWDGLRVPADHPAHLQLVKVVHAAGQARMTVGGDAKQHGLRAVQLPVNLAMPEAATSPCQPWRDQLVTPLAAATELGLYVQASASIMQAGLDGRIAPDLRSTLGGDSDHEAALRFTRAVPGVHTALVGMGSRVHAQEVAGWAARPAPGDAVQALLSGQL